MLRLCENLLVSMTRCFYSDQQVIAGLYEAVYSGQDTFIDSACQLQPNWLDKDVSSPPPRRFRRDDSPPVLSQQCILFPGCPTPISASNGNFTYR